MNHERIKAKLGLWLEGELPAPQAQAVREHLAECPDCARRLARLKPLWQAAREAERVEPPPFLYGRVATRLREYERHRHFLDDFSESLGRSLRRAAVLLLLAGAVAAGVYLGSVPAASTTSAGAASATAVRAQNGGAAYLDSFADLPPESLGGVYVTLVADAK